MMLASASVMGCSPLHGQSFLGIIKGATRVPIKDS